MAEFASPPLGRDQLVLFQEKLDDIIAEVHPVRLLESILNQPVCVCARFLNDDVAEYRLQSLRLRLER